MRKYFIFIIIITLPIQTKAQTFVTDIDGNTYNTVTFGNQEWMRENLRTTHLNENTPILHAADTSLWCNLTDEPAYCWYENNYTTNTIIRGILYNWYAVNTANLCPSGWHVPNITEWQNLVDYLGGLSTAGPKMRGVGSSYYSATGSTCANNSSGLSLGATGIRFEDGSFEGIDFWADGGHQMKITNQIPI